MPNAPMTTQDCHILFEIERLNDIDALDKTHRVHIKRENHVEVVAINMRGEGGRCNNHKRKNRNEDCAIYNRKHPVELFVERSS